MSINSEQCVTEMKVSRQDSILLDYAAKQQQYQSVAHMFLTTGLAGAASVFINSGVLFNERHVTPPSPQISATQTGA